MSLIKASYILIFTFHRAQGNFVSLQTKQFAFHSVIFNNHSHWLIRALVLALKQNYFFYVGIYTNVVT